jgi:hypothetical protein
MKLTLLSDVAKFTLKPNVRKGKNDNLNCGFKLYCGHGSLFNV